MDRRRRLGRIRRLLRGFGRSRRGLEGIRRWVSRLRRDMLERFASKVLSRMSSVNSSL